MKLTVKYVGKGVVPGKPTKLFSDTYALIDVEMCDNRGTKIRGMFTLDDLRKALKVRRGEPVRVDEVFPSALTGE
jgi:hypothetical protein